MRVAPFWLSGRQVAPPSSLAQRPASLTPALTRRPAAPGIAPVIAADVSGGVDPAGPTAGGSGNILREPRHALERRAEHGRPEENRDPRIELHRAAPSCH